MSLGNLVITKSVDEFDSSFYVSKTFEAMDAAIKARRQEILATFRDQKTISYSNHKISEVLADIQK